MTRLTDVDLNHFEAPQAGPVFRSPALCASAAQFCCCRVTESSVFSRLSVEADQGCWKRWAPPRPRIFTTRAFCTPMRGGVASESQELRELAQWSEGHGLGGSPERHGAMTAL